MDKIFYLYNVFKESSLASTDVGIKINRPTTTILADGNAASAELSSVCHWPWEASKGSQKVDVSKKLTPSVG